MMTARPWQGFLQSAAASGILLLLFGLSATISGDSSRLSNGLGWAWFVTTFVLVPVSIYRAHHHTQQLRSQRQRWAARPIITGPPRGGHSAWTSEPAPPWQHPQQTAPMPTQQTTLRRPDRFTTPPPQS